MARHATKKTNIIVFQGSFHGRTIGTMGLTTSKTIYRAGFGPLMSGIHVAPFPYCYSCRIPTSDECCYESLEQIELLLKQQSAPSETAVCLVKIGNTYFPILGIFN